MTKDWFRKTSWSVRDQHEFDVKLRRARASNRAQYLRIQGVHLAEVGLVEPALTLVERMLAKFPSEMTQLAAAHHLRASCLAKLGRDADALAAFRATIETERSFPNVITQGALDFARFIVERHLAELYDEALELVSTYANRSGGLLPIERYLVAAVRAMIADRRDERPEAQAYADVALVAASATHSGLRYHATLGLVPSDAPYMHEIRALAMSSP
jgi:hypothetical protein